MAADAKPLKILHVALGSAPTAVQCRCVCLCAKQALKYTVTHHRMRRLLRPVHTGPNGDEVPAVWVDRAGAKIGFQESRSRNSKANYGLVLEEITTRDEQGAIVTSGD